MDVQVPQVLQAVGRNSDAFTEIIKPLQTPLFRTAYVILGNEADAQEALDETIYKAWRSINKLRESAYFRTWITRILINQCNSMLRHKKREIPLDLLPENIQETFDPLPMHDAVARLPDPYREVIGLRYFSDMTVPQVAETLKLPEGTVKTRLRRALQLLRVSWEEA